MISVYECLINNQIGFQVMDDDTGEIKVISYTSYEVKNNYGKYHILYNSIMEPIETSFEFLNFHLSDRSENTKRKAAQALKLLLSYENIMNKKLKNFKQYDINNFKRFLHGVNTPGNNLNIIMTTVRSNGTVNAYLSIYRQYLSFIGEKNNALNKKTNRHSYFDVYRESIYPANEFVSNEKIANPIEVPKYISVDEFKKIIEVIRSDYSIREEIIVRLMYECGLRIGETMGLTFEDLDITEESISVAYIRNRASDKPYQLAKTCMTIVAREQYKLSKILIKKINKNRASFTFVVKDALFLL
ncbi:tyrosine-type recombinase/integrase [Mammaliicoccus sciuri]|uniref:tyrosine-type recombinase/integrase n=3 Tax=Staphylococcaceae TaxID=90964 RepID=UPI001E53EF8F|nr:tyrosine-type recombinase/integrase [Mammaliicoccus sciuri]MCD8799117.1 tyrosine-type recombinase/integrase [Mammaliicoccus sciuri]